MVEIREFVDDNGAEVSSEVVTLSDEAKSMNKGDMGQLDHIMEKLQENLKMGAGKGVEVDVRVMDTSLFETDVVNVLLLGTRSFYKRDRPYVQLKRGRTQC